MQHYGLQQLAASMRTVRRNTIQIAEDIPESQYHYRPTPESRSVAELLVHIAWLADADHVLHEEAHIEAVADFDFGVLLKQTAEEEKRLRSKSEIIALLRTAGERQVQWLEDRPDEFLAELVRWPDGTSKSRFEMLVGTKEHEMSHRAQLTVIERLLGIVPHFTRNLLASQATAAPREPATAGV